MLVKETCINVTKILKSYIILLGLKSNFKARKSSKLLFCNLRLFKNDLLSRSLLSMFIPITLRTTKISGRSMIDDELILKHFMFSD